MMYVDACFSHLNVVKDKHEDLAAFVREKTGQKMRRVDRYTLLAVAGAMQCSADTPLDSNAAMVLATQTGTLSTTIDMMHKIGIEKRPPKPFQFVNSLGNSACYSIARMFSISGPSLAVSRESFSFESGLQHAELLVEQEGSPQVIVGGLDEAPLPISDHLRRHVNDVESYHGCYEGSHWLRVTRSSAPGRISLELLPEISLNDYEQMGAASIETAVQRAVEMHVNRDASFQVFANFSPAGFTDDQLQNSFHKASLPEAGVLVHGTYSGHAFVSAIQYLNSVAEPSTALIVTLSADERTISIARLLS